MADLRAYLKYGNYVAQFSFPYIEMQAQHEAFMERDMDDFLPRALTSRDLTPEGEGPSEGVGNVEPTTMDFNAEHL
jgi:hypothetical protein